MTKPMNDKQPTPYKFVGEWSGSSPSSGPICPAWMLYRSVATKLSNADEINLEGDYQVYRIGRHTEGNSNLYRIGIRRGSEQATVIQEEAPAENSTSTLDRKYRRMIESTCRTLVADFMRDYVRVPLGNAIEPKQIPEVDPPYLGIDTGWISGVPDAMIAQISGAITRAIFAYRIQSSIAQGPVTRNGLTFSYRDNVSCLREFGLDPINFSMIRVIEVSDGESSGLIIRIFESHDEADYLPRPRYMFASTSVTSAVSLYLKLSELV